MHNFSILPRLSRLLVIHVLISLIERRIRAEQGSRCQLPPGRRSVTYTGK